GLDAAHERGERRDDHEHDRDDEPQLALPHEGDRRLAGVEVVAEVVQGAHQASPSRFVFCVSSARSSCARLRSAIVWRRSASPRERTARPVAATGSRKRVRVWCTAPSARGSSPDSGWPPPKKRVRTSSCITGCVKTTK